MARILYLHGSGHTHASFANQVRAFPDTEALALPGHPDGEPLGTVAELADWLDARITAAAAGPTVVCGNSLGAAIALTTALSHPASVAGLILIGGGARLRVGGQIFEMIDEGWPGCIETLVDLSVDASCPTDLRRQLADMHRVIGQNTTRTDYAACNAFDAMDRVRGLSLPTLIIVGANDRMTPPKYSTFLHESIAGSELVIVDRAGHLPHLEQPSAVNTAIANWL